MTDDTSPGRAFSSAGRALIDGFERGLLTPFSEAMVSILPGPDPALASPFAEAMVHIRRRAGLPRFTVRRVPIGTWTPFGLAWVIRDREYPFFIGRARTHAEAIQRIDERARRY